MKIGLVAQRDNSRAVEVADTVRSALVADGVDCRLDTATATSLDVPDAGSEIESFDECDLVVSIGGDGTFLFAARAAGGTPMVGVNLGEVGFLNAVRPENAVNAVRETVAAIRKTATRSGRHPDSRRPAAGSKARPRSTRSSSTGRGGATAAVRPSRLPSTAQRIRRATPTAC
ncbi:MAG: putative sugar kinase [uncultured archaeon A07HN63]|nr:MAG: putative sugar kinase [uncultured archaeon A07HN63]